MPAHALTNPPAGVRSARSEKDRGDSRVHQKDFPAKQPQAQAAPWFPLAYGHKEWPQGPGPAPCERPQAHQRLIATVIADAETTVKSSNTGSAPLACAKLRVRREFLFVANGLDERRRNLVVQARRREPPRDAAGIGFTATKKVGNSVVRNRARRRLREAARSLIPRLGLSSVDYVFIARQQTADCPWGALLDDMESALVSLRGRIEAGETSQRTPQSRRRARSKRPKA